MKNGSPGRNRTYNLRSAIQRRIPPMMSAPAWVLSSIWAYYGSPFVRLEEPLRALFGPLCAPISFGSFRVIAPMEWETGRAERYVAAGAALGVSRAKQRSAIGAFGSRRAGACSTQRVLKTSKLEHPAVAHLFGSELCAGIRRIDPGAEVACSPVFPCTLVPFHQSPQLT